MCGRFTQTKNKKEALQQLATIELPPLFHRRYNVVPTQKVAAIRQNNPRRATESIWGLINPHSGAPIINARIETLSERTMFRPLLDHHRCLIPADGFYEWKDRQPYYFQRPDHSLFAFAGLFQDGHCVIITRSADENMHGIHDRMPLMLPLKNRAHWFNTPTEKLKTFFDSENPLQLIHRPVSRRVNSVTKDDSDCLNPGEIQTRFF